MKEFYCEILKCKLLTCNLSFCSQSYLTRFKDSSLSVLVDLWYLNVVEILACPIMFDTVDKGTFPSFSKSEINPWRNECELYSSDSKASLICLFKR